jgi:hypothetical protein
VFPCDRYKDKGSEIVCEGGKKEKGKTLGIEIKRTKILLIKQQVKNHASITSMTIDDFTYVFVRDLLHGGSYMLTV